MAWYFCFVYVRAVVVLVVILVHFFLRLPWVPLSHCNCSVQSDLWLNPYDRCLDFMKFRCRCLAWTVELVEQYN